MEPGEGDIAINGHRLPRRLADLLSRGLWARSRKAAKLDGLPLDQEYLSFLSAKSMTDNTLELQVLLKAGLGPLLGLSRGSSGGPGFVDVDQVVIIAANYAQEAIALDYSGRSVPRVVCTNDEQGGPKWVEVSEDFDGFMRLVGLDDVH